MRHPRKHVGTSLEKLCEAYTNWARANGEPLLSQATLERYFSYQFPRLPNGNFSCDLNETGSKFLVKPSPSAPEGSENR